MDELSDLSLFGKLKHKIRPIIFPTKEMRFQQLQDDYALFQQKCMEQWGTYPAYLLKTESAQLSEQVHKFQSSTQRYGFWFRDLITPLKKIYKEDLATIQSYNSKYLAKEKRNHQGFFLGKESQAKIGMNLEQIHAILVNESSNLLIAGPGSGKTRVITERTAFYHLKKGVAENKILILAFNTSAAAEIRTRLQQSYGMADVDVRTFHSLGMHILTQIGKIQNKHVKVEANPNRKLHRIITSFLNSSPQFRLDYDVFFNHYLAELNFTEYHATNQQLLDQKATLKYRALDGEQVKSIGERDIANFFLQNGIEYRYEPLVTWCDPDTDPTYAANPRQYHPDFYLPAYGIYLEHWAISEEGVPPSWFHDDANQYHANRIWKRNQFQKYGKLLWETDYQDWINGRLKSKLTALCRSHQIPLTPVPRAILLQNLGKTVDDRGILADQIIAYVQAAKNSGFTALQFQRKVLDRIYSLNAFDASFFALVVPIFLQYEQDLVHQSKIDFNDMINGAIEILQDLPNLDSSVKELFTYDLIFVDEYQDISPQRYHLLELMRQLNPHSRVFCVGDDWQAIYGFAGATNTYLTQYKNHFDPVECNFLQQNYRNTPSILKYGEQIIAKSSDFIPKQFRPFNQILASSISLVRVKSSDQQWFQRDQKEKVLEQIRRLIEEDHIPASEIMVLSRFNFGYTTIKEACEQNQEIPVQLEKNGVIIKEGIRFYSTHKSKGLEADVVIILNLIKGQFGFPSEIDSGINYQFINEKIGSRADEEARLFFVALTRARKQIFLFTWEDNESIYIPSSPSPETLYQIYQDQNFWVALIVRQTERALLLKIEVLFSECVDLWVPKSKILSSYEVDFQHFQRFKIAANYIDSQKFIAKNITTKNHQTEATNSNEIRGFVMKATPKAYLMRIPNSQGDFKSVWVPKSVILNIIEVNHKAFQKVEVKQWWINKQSEMK